MPHSPSCAPKAHIIAHINNWPTFPEVSVQETLTFGSEVTALMGRNGTGKTRLCRLLLGLESWPETPVARHSRLGYLPQTSVPPDDRSISDHLGVTQILTALAALEAGDGDDRDLEILNDRWSLREDVEAALAVVGLHGLDLDLVRPVSSLSGGEFTRLELVRLQLAGAEFLVLDEPTNHLDVDARTFVLEFIKSWKGGLLVVSHDREVLRLAARIMELTSLGLKTYRGSYNDFVVQREQEASAAERKAEDAEKRVRHIKREAQASKEKAASRSQTGKKMRRDGSHGKSLLDGMKGQAENSAGRRLAKNTESLETASQALKSAETGLERYRRLSFDLPSSGVKSGQGLLRLEDFCFGYGQDGALLIDNLSFALNGGEKLALTGRNGSGKSTLLRLIGNKIATAEHRLSGKLTLTASRVAWLDQKTELIEGEETVMDAFGLINPAAKPGEAHAALARFLFRNDDAFKRVEHLSGGERLRTALAALLYSPEPPQLLLLDEPNNHLDLDSQIAVASALSAFDGGILIVSHDEAFLEDVGVTSRVELSN